MAFTRLHQSNQWIILNCIWALDKAQDFGLADADVTGSATAAALVTAMKAEVTTQNDTHWKAVFEIFNTALDAGAFVDADIAAATGISNLRGSLEDLVEFTSVPAGVDPQLHP
jgi:hypothetical protein